MSTGSTVEHKKKKTGILLCLKIVVLCREEEEEEEAEHGGFDAKQGRGAVLSVALGVRSGGDAGLLQRREQPIQPLHRHLAVPRREEQPRRPAPQLHRVLPRSSLQDMGEFPGSSGCVHCLGVAVRVRLPQEAKAAAVHH